MRGSNVVVGLALALGAVCAVAGCTEDGLPGQVLGKGLGRNLIVAPGGGAVAFLLDAAHPDDRTVPDDLVAGDLWLSATGAQAAGMKVGSGVPSLPGVAQFSAKGEALAYLADWRFRTGEGVLMLTAPGRKPVQLAEVASAFTWSPVGTALAYVSRGRLQVSMTPLTPGKTFTLDGVQTFNWSPDGKLIAARAPSLAGGKLMLLELTGGTVRELGPSTDFSFAQDGALAYLGLTGPKGGDRTLSILEPSAKAPRELGRATAFAFSPDLTQLGVLSTDRSPGDAFGDLGVIPRAGGPLRVLGSRVSEWRFTSKGDLLFLAGYELSARAGTLMFAPGAGGESREVGRKKDQPGHRTQSFQVNAKGDRVLSIVQKADKRDFKLELWTQSLTNVDDGKKLDEGVYGFLITPDGANLFWKSRCQGLRSCVLFRAPIDGSREPTLVSKDVAGFDLSEDGKRLLVAHGHKHAARAVDLSLLDAMGPPVDPPVRPFALEVDPGARFVDAQGKRVVAAKLGAHEPKVVAIELP
ncbi:MAG: hypothetical protein JST92_22990 [Deltaproteobacteria bacterium]|nr:hypothetical protein [Deltaproteobacteria bacterium]